MKNEHKIYAFFSFLCLLVSNCFVLKLLYVDSGDIFYSKISQIVIWSNTFFWALAAFLFYRNKIKRSIGNVIFSASFIIILYMFTVAADRFIGLFIHIEGKREALVFEPNTVAHYKTTEFDFVAKINSVGLRGKEIDIKRNDKKRILCFGDSWTFGWGVNIDQTWPKVMEDYLAGNGYPVEVINCGRGAQHTSTYKVFMKQLVPLLKPDIVIIGVLQLDDLMQLSKVLAKFHPGLYERTMAYLVNAVNKFKNKSYKNSIALLENRFPHRPIEVTSEWKNQSNSFISGFNIDEASKYEMFDDSVKAMFESGNLNPGLLPGYIWFPEKCLIFNDPNYNATKFAVGRMTDDFNKMKKICDENRCLLIFCNLPWNEFTGHIVKRTPIANSMFQDYLFNNNRIDAIYRGVADKAGVPYFELTDIFKKLEPKDSFFFLYDGHPTEKGYEVIGRSIAGYLIENKFLTAEKNGN